MSALLSYLDALDLSQRMLREACAKNWDALVALEQQRRRVILAAHDAPRPSAELARLGEAMREILSLDAQIMEHIGPWMEHTGQLLKAFGPPSSTST